MPAVTEAGYEPIPPITKGGEIIIAEIIRELSRADMVLCDISSHNPNVFYELGIRTALDKPVAIVRDTCTTKIPFDTAAINVEEYPHDLRPWNVAATKTRIATHIKDSASKAGGRNAAWRYFGVTENAQFAPQKATQQDKLDVILTRIDQLESAQMHSPRLLHTVGDYCKTGRFGEMVGKSVAFEGRQARIVGVAAARNLMLVSPDELTTHHLNLKSEEVQSLLVFS